MEVKQDLVAHLFTCIKIDQQDKVQTQNLEITHVHQIVSHPCSTDFKNFTFPFLHRVNYYYFYKLNHKL